MRSRNSWENDIRELVSTAAQERDRRERWRDIAAAATLTLVIVEIIHFVL